MIGITDLIPLIKDLPGLVKGLLSLHPDSNFRRAEEFLYDPKQAFPHYLTYLQQTKTKPTKKSAKAIGYILDYCLHKHSLSLQDLILRGSAVPESESVILTTDSNGSKGSGNTCLPRC